MFIINLFEKADMFPHSTQIVTAILKNDLDLDEISMYPFFMRESGSAGREITDGLLKSYQLRKYKWL